MKKLILPGLFLAIIFCSCHKAPNDEAIDYPALETQVLNDFTTKLAMPQYENLQLKAQALNNAIVQLNANATDDNLAAAQQSWRDTRTSWEQCEGFLFGPVEDDNYDPQMDTWPVDYVQMDSLLASSNPLQPEDIKQLSTLSLRGFHPVEYVLWGKDGNEKAADISARKKQYISSLSEDIVDNTTELNNSWKSEGGNFAAAITNARKGSTRYQNRQEVFLAIAGALSDICGEVGDSKMNDPFVQRDSTISESPFSHNSTIDFRNNIIGAQNIYLGTYNNAQAKSLSDMVSAKNIALDNKIRQQFTAALNSFNAITLPFEEAIYDQRTQVQNTLDALADLKQTLDDELILFIRQYVKD